MNLFFKFLNMVVKKRCVWVVYEMWEEPGQSAILGCYLDHDEASNELDKLRGRFPMKKYGIQMSRMNGKH